MIAGLLLAGGVFVYSCVICLPQCVLVRLISFFIYAHVQLIVDLSYWCVPPGVCVFEFLLLLLLFVYSVFVCVYTICADTKPTG